MFDEIEKVKEEDRFVNSCEVVVSEVEKEYLNLTPKFREYENLGIRK